MTVWRMLSGGTTSASIPLSIDATEIRGPLARSVVRRTGALQMLGPLSTWAVTAGCR